MLHSWESKSAVCGTAIPAASAKYFYVCVSREKVYSFPIL